MESNGESAPPTILQDNQPLTETAMSSEANPPLVQSPSALTDTNLLSSFSSGHSSLFGSCAALSTMASSTSASRRSSMQFTKPVEVKETLDASLTENEDGERQLKQYALKQVIGRGAYGIVNLGVDDQTGVHYAIKEFSKSKLRKKDKANLFRLGPRGRGRGRRGPEAPSPLSSESSPLELIRGEVAILKKLNHINIVRLYEVLDVAAEDSMYMVFELCERGALMTVSMTEASTDVFSDEECRDIFQQMVLGIEYLHEHDIIHRDIKPDNLLRSTDGTLKIVDFGVSEMFQKGNDRTKKSAGSPAFMAPELCRPDHGEVSGRATDVWSMGVTLYCIRYGVLPFVTQNILDLNRMIREEEFDLSLEKDDRFRGLMKRLLEKDPAKRMTIEEMRNDPWLTNDGREPLISKEENTSTAVTEVTEDDLRGAIQRINSLATVFKAITKFKRLMKSPTSRSSTMSLPTQDTVEVLNPVPSLDERMQDADETIAAPVEVKESEQKKPEQGEPIETSSAEDSMADAEVAAVLERSERKEELTVEAPKVEGPKQDEPKEDKLQKEEPKAEEELKTEKEEEEVPQGYEMCDMETGMCYWVPFKKTPEETPQDKVLPPAPATAAVVGKEASVIDKKEEDSTPVEPPVINLASSDDLSPPPTTMSEPEPEIKDGDSTASANTSSARPPLLETTSSTATTLTSSTAQSDYSTTSTLASNSSSSVPVMTKLSELVSGSGSGSSITAAEKFPRSPSSPSVLSRSASPSLGASASGGGGSTPPARPSTPSLPRTVGKLSKERLAMFEQVSLSSS